jgi:uncharacterized membrane protein
MVRAAPVDSLGDMTNNLQISPDAPFVLHALAAIALVLHIGGGATGIVSGFIAILARKGGRTHRAAGTVFFVAMLIMTGIATIVAPMLDAEQWVNTTMAVFTFYLTATAWATVRRGAGEIGRFERAAAVVPIGVAAVGLGLAWVGVRTGTAGAYGPVYPFSVIAALAAVCDVRMIRRGGISGASRIARHLWRMSLALFVATGSFFLGQQKFLPEEVRGTILPALPVLAIPALLIFWLLRTRFTNAFKPNPAAA